MSQDAFRDALQSVGIPVDEDWTIQELSVKRDIRQVEDGADVYGNTPTFVQVVGTQISLVVYKTEN